MSCQMINIHHGNTQRTGEPFGKRHAYQQRTHQSRTARKRHSAQFLFGNSGTLQRLVHYRHYILLMRT